MPDVFDGRSWLSALVKHAGLLVFGIGFASLLGYIPGWEPLQLWPGSRAPMASNTAFALVLAGLGLWAAGKSIALHSESIRTLESKCGDD